MELVSGRRFAGRILVLHAAAPSSFAETYAEAAPRLRRLAAALGFSTPDIDDVLQEVCLELLDRPGTWRTAQEAHGWLTRVTVNICMREYRRRRRFAKAVASRLQQAPAAQGDDPSSNSLVRRDNIDRTRTALADLPPDLAVPLVMRYFCDFDATRIGELLELPPATVRGRLRRARLWLAEQLADEDRP